jgi:hypothetical protein
VLPVLSVQVLGVYLIGGPAAEILPGLGLTTRFTISYYYKRARVIARSAPQWKIPVPTFKERCVFGKCVNLPDGGYRWIPAYDELDGGG